MSTESPVNFTGACSPKGMRREIAALKGYITTPSDCAHKEDWLFLNEDGGFVNRLQYMHYCMLNSWQSWVQWEACSVLPHLTGHRFSTFAS